MRKRHIKARSKKESRVISVFVRALLAFLVVVTQIVLPIAPAFANETGDGSSAEEVETASEEISADENINGDVTAGEEETAPVESDEEVGVEEDVEVEPVMSEEASVDEQDMTSEATLSQEETIEHEIITEDESTDPSASSEGTGSGSEAGVPAEDATPPTVEEDGESDVSVTENDELEPPPVPADIPAEEILETTPIEDEESAPASEEALEEMDEEVIAATSTSTTTQNIVEPELHTVSTESMYTFDMGDCARVADGSFYCTPESEGEVKFTDRIFAGPDSDGDSEIFIEKDGVLTQLTSNIADDAAPFYDERSNTVVFHRLVDARYQIVSLDLETSEEEQLTFDSYNNMQPSRFGDLIVWQGWVGNDWEIILSNDGEISMLTDNTTHDIGPRINGEFVIWQAESETGWEVRVYNTLTGFTESIDETEGASIENPRLVLVYDAKHGNGDVETRGYDLTTGRSVSLNSESGSIPDDLPDPDQTGEERALITASQLKTKTEDDESEDDPLPLTPESGTDSGTETSTESPVIDGDIVIPPYVSNSTTNVSGEQEDDTAMPEDLVVTVEPHVPSEPLIPDLVISPFVIESEEATDSQ
jgi:hypothetical protein